MNLDKRLEDIGWALFLMMVGILWLVPDSVVPRGTWILATGMIMIGINAIRSMNGIPINRVSTALGVFALVAGAVSIAGVDLPLFPILLVVIGAMILVKPLFARPATR